MSDELNLSSDDICAFQNAIQQLEWIASGTTPGRNHDLYDDRNKATIRDAMRHAKGALDRLKPAYARLIDVWRDKSQGEPHLSAPSAPAVQKSIAKADPYDEQWLTVRILAKGDWDGEQATTAAEAVSAALYHVHHTRPGLIIAWDEIEQTSAVQPDADPNVPWLTLAHTICADAGIAPGNITDRLNQLREHIAPTRQAPVAYMYKAKHSGGLPFLAHYLAADLEPWESVTPLYAAPVPAIPPGYALVPIEPTPEMIDNTAAFDIGNENGEGMSCSLVYKAMLAASPNQFHKK